MRYFGIYKTTWYCIWCGKTYKPLKETERDGPCSPKCKQAHYRAYKKSTDWKMGKRGKRGKYKKEALPQKKRSKKTKAGTRKTSNAKKRKFKRPVRVKFRTGKGPVKKLLTIIIVLGAVLFLVGCHQDNRKRIKPDLLDDEYRQTQEYKERFDVIMYRFWEERQRRSAHVQDPNLSKPVKR